MRHSLSAAAAAALLSTLLGACGFMTPAQQYAGEPRPVADIAVLQAYVGSPLGDEYHATISGVSHQPPKGPSSVKRFGLPGFTDYPHQIQLTPGSYALELYCFKSLTKPTFRPSYAIAVKAGYAYTLKCDVAEGKATVFISQETRAL